MRGGRRSSWLADRPLPMRRFVIRPGAIEGDRVRFDADETHHLARVLRLRPGALVEAADGGGRVFTVRIEALGAREAWGTIVERSGEGTPARESPCAITLAQAILKGERMIWLIQKATELGVARIVPLETARVVGRVPASRLTARQQRWERVAREAVKQCGRTVVPSVEVPRPLAAMLAETAAHDAAWLCWEGGGIAVAEVAREAGRPRRLLLLVGPEGGFTAEEVAQAERAGARLVGLGPRILRAESAGLVAIALCQHLFGDLGRIGP
jgi:16S rRNA (uracil1498-N3)-methyltransferase